MKRLNEYLNEDFDTAVYNSDGGISIDDPTVVDAINAALERATAHPCRTPYVALEEVRKILAYYKIFLPKSIFLDQNHGNDSFQISQFGDKMGMNNQGEVMTAHPSPLFVYFEWELNEMGRYDIFASVVNEDELDEILSDYESETDEDETDLQEKTMPDLERKMDAQMGSKKVSLPKRQEMTPKNVHEEQLNELKMDKKTYVSAMQRTTGYDSDYSGEGGRIDTDKLIARAKKYKGAKFAKQLAGADQMTSRPNRNVVSGQWGNDQLAWRKPTRKTKSGKANKTDLQSLKGSLTKGDYRKPSFKKRNLPEEEQLNELHGKTKIALQAVKKRLEKRHDAEWEATHEKRAREKLKGSEKTKKEDKSRNDLAKRWLRADRAEKKLSEATEEEKRQKRLAKWVPKEKKKKLGKNAQLMAGWADEIRQVRAGMKAHQEKLKARREKKLDEAVFGGKKYKRDNPNNAKSKKTDAELSQIQRDAHSKVADTRGTSKGKWTLRKANAAFDIGLKRKMNRDYPMPPKQPKKLDEITSGKANDAYHSAMDKMSTADMMAGVSKGDLKKKWAARAAKRRGQAEKFANYSDVKKHGYYMKYDKDGKATKATKVTKE